MRYLFEDNREDILSKLYCFAYPSNVSDGFDFLNGNGSLASTAESILINSDDELVFVFMDTIPANRCIKKIYYDLKELYKLYGRLFVFPLVCSEYYFIKFLCTIKFPVIDLNALNFCIGKNFYENSTLVSDETSKVFARNFERFCKLVLVHDNVLYSCLKKDKDTDILKFLCVDCICDTGLCNCKPLSLKEKAMGYLREFPVFPSGSYLNEKVLTKDEIIEMHRKLVDEFNIWSDTYKAVDKNVKNRYFHLPYII